MEALKQEERRFVWQYDLEDIIFVLDNRHSVAEELLSSDPNVKDYLKNKFHKHLKNKNFEEALIRAYRAIRTNTKKK